MIHPISWVNPKYIDKGNILEYLSSYKLSCTQCTSNLNMCTCLCWQSCPYSRMQIFKLLFQSSIMIALDNWLREARWFLVFVSVIHVFFQQNVEGSCLWDSESESESRSCLFTSFLSFLSFNRVFLLQAKRKNRIKIWQGHFLFFGENYVCSEGVSPCDSIVLCSLTKLYFPLAFFIIYSMQSRNW